MMMEEPAFITIPYQEFKVIVQEVHSLRDQIAALEAHQLDDTARLAREIALDRQRLTKLEKVDPRPLQRDRGDILRALIAANGGRMLAKDARQKMHLSKELFSMLIASMSDYIEIKPLRSDKRRKVLSLK